MQEQQQLQEEDMSNMSLAVVTINQAEIIITVHPWLPKRCVTTETSNIPTHVYEPT